MAFDAALGASDESNFMSDQEFIPDCGISTLMAAFPAWLGIVSKFIDSVAGSVGFNVEVIPVGNTTYGEPFGFYAQDDCGTADFRFSFAPKTIAASAITSMASHAP